MMHEEPKRLAGVIADAVSVAGLSLGTPALLAAVIRWDAWFLGFLVSPPAIGLMAAIATAAFFVILRRRPAASTRSAIQH